MPGKHVPMKPTKAWALVSAESGKALEVDTYRSSLTQHYPRSLASGEVRLARVTITESDGWLDPSTLPRDGKDKILVVDRVGNYAVVPPSDLTFVDGFGCVTAPDHDILTIVGWMPLPEPPKARKK